MLSISCAGGARARHGGGRPAIEKERPAGVSVHISHKCSSGSEKTSVGGTESGAYL